MRRTAAGLVVLGLAVLGGLVNPAEAGAVSDCDVSVNVNLFPQMRQQAVDCKGSPSGPWKWPTADELVPDPDIDVDFTW